MNEFKKICADCKTTRTPLWRSGPHGPRSLCNACGIKYRKKKMADDEQHQHQQQRQPSSETRREKQSSSRSGDYDENRVNDQVLKRGYSNMGNRIFAQRSSLSSSSSSSSQLKKQRSSSEESSITINSKRSLGEVEQAAVLLMSLSCGSCFA
ncbi:hypothetical protein SOVF_138220 [Spinacia oleracea]|uniref:GATA transcription factor 16 n=1 Tax=Spinacia oleracea TaxID=3562 RepID=A0A9R0JHW2_SPIOL|nr:GATA transcription factor 16-like [Spinacia oleracea]KNA11097.1 hypothetical protein SOVF_138220 [Spinacia oleracea]